MSPRSITLLVVLTAAALASWYLARNNRIDDTDEVPYESVHRGYYLKSARILGTREDGQLLYEIEAARAEQQAKDRIEFTDVTEDRRAAIYRLWSFLMYWAVEPENREFVLADLEDGFEEVRQLHGHGEANRWCRRQALKSLGPCLRGRILRSLRRATSGDSRRLSVNYGRRPGTRARCWLNAVVVSLNDFRYGARNLGNCISLLLH